MRSGPFVQLSVVKFTAEVSLVGKHSMRYLTLWHMIVGLWIQPVEITPPQQFLVFPSNLCASTLKVSQGHFSLLKAWLTVH